MKLKLMRYALLKKHTELVRQGELDVARRILRFLTIKEISLFLSDADNETETILCEIGFKINYSRSGHKATVFYAV